MKPEARWIVPLQILVGACFGAIGGGISYLILDAIWRHVPRSFINGGLIYSLLICISFLLCSAAAFVAVGEGVRLMGRLGGRTYSRRQLYRGAFLGTSAAVALFSLVNVNWDDIVMRFAPPFSWIVRLVELVCLIISLPFRMLLWMKVPPVLIFALAAPIGALVVEKFNSIRPIDGKGEGSRR